MTVRWEQYGVNNLAILYIFEQVVQLVFLIQGFTSWSENLKEGEWQLTRRFANREGAMRRNLLGLYTLGILGGICAATSATAQECYVDNEGGSSQASGQSEEEAVDSLDAIPSGCTTVHFKRGNVYNGKLELTQGITTYTNYGDESDPLPKFVVPRTEMSGPLVQGMMGGRR
jgi:hypothetical protein